jgi:hypothetical protein
MNNYLRILLSVFILVGGTAVADTEILDFCTKRDLELTDSVNPAHRSVAAAIDRTRTKVGAQLLRHKLEHPFTDAGQILAYQTKTKKLVQNSKRLAKLEALLDYIALYQESFTFFDPATTPEALKAVVDSFLYDSSLLQSWNDKPFALNMRHTMQSFSPLITTAFEFLVLHYALEYLLHKKGDHHDHHDHACEGGCIHHIDVPSNAPAIKQVLAKLVKAGHIALHLISIKDMIEFVSTKMEVMNQVYQQLCALQGVMDAVGQVARLQGEQGVAANLASLQEHMANGYFSQKLDDGDELGLFSPVGQTLVSYAAVQKDIARLQNLKQFIAEVDVQCSVARLVLDSQGADKQFCFAEIMAKPEGAEKGPLLVMHDGWHVMLDQNKVVGNTFCAHNEVLKFILTGPNRSGKSSFLRTAGVNAVLSQAFGIAAAKQFMLMPFAKIMSFMTITDDITTGQSSHVARMMRADDMLRMQKELTPEQHALVLIDDSLGQATTAQRGEQIAYDFINTMGEYNNLMLCATHIYKLTTLAQVTKGRFVNMRMKVIKGPNRKAQETYELEDGVSDARDAGILA